MKRARIRDFVESFLAHRGAQLEAEGPALLKATLPGDDGSPPPEAKLIVFSKRAHRAHSDAELAVVGSAFLDRLVGEATSSGRYVVTYRPPPQGQAHRPRLDLLPEVSNGHWSRPRKSFRPLFLFVYVAEYRTIDVPDDLELIALDPARGEVISSPGPLIEDLRSGETEVPERWKPIPALPTPGAVLHSLRTLDRRLRRRARRVKEAAALEIARETANIEAYYRQLIYEVRHPVGRGRLSSEQEAERVRALQLGWKRRVQEVARFWEAGVTVRLSALGVVMEPCWAVALSGPGKRAGRRGGGPVFLTADYETGILLKPRCPACGIPIGERAELAGSDLVCPGHLQPSEAAETLDRKPLHRRTIG